MGEKQDPATLKAPEMDDTDEAVARQSAILQQSIRNNNIRHQNEKRALECNNTKLLVRIDELEREHEELKRELEAAIQASGTALPHIEPLSKLHTSALPHSSATVPTQEATVPFQEYKELERIYKVVLRENDELRQNSEQLAKQHDGMKARVKEWNKWATKERTKRCKGCHDNVTGKPAKGFRVDTDRLPTPMSIVSTHLNVQSSLGPGPDAEDVRRRIAEEAFQFLENHGSPLKESSTTADLPEAGSSDGHCVQEELPQTYRIADPTATSAEQQPAEVSSEQQKSQSSQRDQDDAQSHTHRDSLRITSSQTTQDADDDLENMQDAGKHADQHHSDDEPTIISERSLKRKYPNHVEVYQDSPKRRSEPPTRIKAEPLEVQPTAQGIPALLHRASTLDLDTMEIQFQTPRKRRRMQEAIHNSQLQGDLWKKRCPTLHHERSSSLQLARPAGDVKLEDHDKNVVLEIPDSDPSPAAEEQDDPLESAKAILTRSPNNPRKANALRSRDVNIQPQPQFGALSTLRPRRAGDAERGAKAVPMLSEDGEDAEIPRLSPAKMEESRRRFAELYENPPPERKALQSPRTPAPSRATRSSPRSTVAKSRNAPTPNRKRAALSTSTKKSRTAQLPTPQTETRTSNSARSFRQCIQKQVPSAPLREKPIPGLELSDFKINPVTNAGLDFAYAEVIRSRDARRCLPGCTKPDCCGHELRAMVEAGLNPPLPRSFWDDSQSQDQRPFASEQEAEDHKYLQWFMGDGYHRDRVDAMPSVQRKDLVVQSKMKLLANQAGRHKHAHQRARTPPGFWRADFPGTQEREKDRLEARRRERDAIYERWTEAMTGNGHWIFRDE